MIFKRKNKADEAAAGATSTETATDTTAAPAAAVAPVDGPFDGDLVKGRDGYLDLGALQIEPVPGMQLRLEVEDSTQRVIAVGLEVGGSRLQLQVFAAPKTAGLWEGISEQIAVGITEQGGAVERSTGRFGEEMLARVPSTAPDGSTGYIALRFLGIDGPRWFLRGVIGGEAVTNEAESKALEDLLARVIVVRGDKPMPPAELLPLTVPAGAVAQSDASEAAESPEGLERPERGPEVTQIG